MYSSHFCESIASYCSAFRCYNERFTETGWERHVKRPFCKHHWEILSQEIKLFLLGEQNAGQESLSPAYMMAMGWALKYILEKEGAVLTWA